MKNNFLFLLGIFLIMFLFLYISPSLDVMKLSIQMIYAVMLSSLIYSLSLFFRTLSLPLVLSINDYKLLLYALYSMVLNEIFVKTSGDLAKAHFLINYGFSKMKSVKISIFDRILASISLACLPLLFIFPYALIPLFVVFSFIFSLVFSLKFRNVLLAIVSAFLGWVLEVYALKVVFLESISMFYLSVLVVGYTFLSYLAFIPMGLGIRESIFVGFSTLLEKSKDAFFVSSLYFRISTLLAFLYVFIFLKIIKNNFALSTLKGG